MDSRWSLPQHDSSRGGNDGMRSSLATSKFRISVARLIGYPKTAWYSCESCLLQQFQAHAAFDPSGQKPFHVLADDVRLQVHAVAPFLETEGGQSGRMGDHGDGETRFVYVRHRQADAVDGDGTFFDDVPEDLVRRIDEYPPAIPLDALLPYPADRVNVPAHEVAADPCGKLERPFQVHFRADRKFAQVRDFERFNRHISGE